MRKRTLAGQESRQSIDDLFAEFVHEMNRFSTNGVVRDVDHDRVVEMAGHFLSQCRSKEDRSLLEEQILLLLSAKYNYRVLENDLRLSRRLEVSVRDAIERICRKYFKDASRFAGLVADWSIVKPFKLFKSALEPAIANTVLTYSIAVHAPHLDRVDLQTRLVDVTSEPVTQVAETANYHAGLYAELEQVRPYSNEDLEGLMATVRRPSERPEPRPVTGFSESQGLTENGVAIRKLVEVDRETSVTDQGRKEKKYAEQVRMEKSLVSEIRPIGAVQEVISQHELKIFTCYKLSQNKLQEKHGRVSVRFAITAQGMTKDVSVLHNSFNEDLATRIANQIKYFRFSSIDAKLGDQTIYHTFYF